MIRTLAVLLVLSGSAFAQNSPKMCESGGGVWMNNECVGFHADQLPPIFNQHETSEEAQSQTLTLCNIPTDNSVTLIFNPVLNCWQPRDE